MQPDKYKNKFRISSARLASWDYGSNAAYFITICTRDRVHAFGEIVDGEAKLTKLGLVAWECWYAIPEHFPFVLLDVFVAMPNHVHGILIIDKPLSNVDNAVEVANATNVWPPETKNRFGPQSQNLASIVRGYKIGVTKYARQHQIEFAWQARYHDHIVRNATECEHIRKYIIDNPQQWLVDTFYNSRTS